MKRTYFKKNRFIIMIAVLVMSFSAICPAYGASTWGQISSGNYQMIDGTSITGVVARGIDVSHWQGTIDWEKVSKDDISFVMLGTRYSGNIDPLFRENASAAASHGIALGAYIYSYATNTQMASQEADFILSLIKDYPISYPVAFDVEDNVQGNLTKDELMAIINTFCDKIQTAGYYPIVYANDYWLANKIDTDSLRFPVWVARYENRHVFSSPVMWQATSTGSIDGITGNVDIDFQYTGFSDVILPNLWRTIQNNTYYYRNYTMVKSDWVNDETGTYYMDTNGLLYKGWLNNPSMADSQVSLPGNPSSGSESIAGSESQPGSSSSTITGPGASSSSGVAIGPGASSSGNIMIGPGASSSSSDTVSSNQNASSVKGTYYLDSVTGRMATGWQKLNQVWYYFAPSGQMQTGWILDENEWYYLAGDGIMATGWISDAGTRYYLKGSGVMATGWRHMDNCWYYFNPSGSLATGWQEINGAHYYLNPDSGVMASGWYHEDGQSYYLDPDSGSRCSGWRMIDNKWYYFQEDGRMITGAVVLKDVMYYLDPSNGQMAENTDLTIDGILYHAGSSGACVKIEAGSDPSVPDSAVIPSETSDTIPETSAENSSVTPIGPGM